MAALNNPTFLSDSQLAPWLHEAEPLRIQLAQRLPFFACEGHELRYTATPALESAVFARTPGGIPDQTAQVGSKDQFPLVELATRFCLSYQDQDVFSASVNDQIEVQHRLAIRRLLYRFWTDFENGKPSLGQFAGLNELVDDRRVVDLDHQPLTLEDLECGKELVRSHDGRGTVILTDSPGKRAINSAHWQRGVSPPSVALSEQCPCEGNTHWSLAFDGAPVYVNDPRELVDSCSGGAGTQASPARARGATDVWFLALGSGGLHGIVPPLEDDSMFRVRRTEDHDRGSTVFDVTFPVGLALASASAVAVVRNVAVGDIRKEPANG